jgi:hypothetical protein
MVNEITLIRPDIPLHLFTMAKNLFSMPDPAPAGEERPSRFDRFARTPLLVGFLIGILAAISQGLLISAGGLEAYGYCVACHTRDLVNVAVNTVAGTKLAVAAISQNAVLPVLTDVGVLIGAFSAAKAHGEFRTKKGSALSYLWYGLGGLFFMTFALFMGGCPYRIGLRIGYGDFIALLGLLGIVGGVYIGLKIATRRAEREV